MTSIEDANPNDLILALASELEKVEQITAPEWAKFVKTGVHKERPPVQDNWWHIRSASILRAIFKNGPIGVAKLRSKYGGRKSRGSKPSKFKRGSGNIIRKILQQLQAAEFIKFQEKGVHKGRVIAPKGQALLQKLANTVKKAPKVEKKEKPKAKEKIEKIEKEVKEAIKVEEPKVKTPIKIEKEKKEEKVEIKEAPKQEKLEVEVKEDKK